MTEVPQIDTDRHLETFTATWRGITLEITSEPRWPAGPDGHLVRLAVRSLSPAAAPLPISKTGQRSLSLMSGTIAELGGPVAFVLTWLDEQAQELASHAQENAAPQLSLF